APAQPRPPVPASLRPVRARAAEAGLHLSCAQASSLTRTEIFDSRRRLPRAGWLEEAVLVDEVDFIAEHDLMIVFGADLLQPDRIGGAVVAACHRPRPRQGMIDGRDLVMQEARIGPVQKDALLDDGLVVLVQRQAAIVERARFLEAARLDDKRVVASVAVG